MNRLFQFLRLFEILGNRRRRRLALEGAAGAALAFLVLLVLMALLLAL